MIAKLEGFLGPGLYHLINGERVAGPNSRLEGECSGLWGDCSRLWGNLEDCEISDGERQAGIAIRELVAPPKERDTKENIAE